MNDICSQCKNRFKCLTESRAGNCLVIIEGRRWFEKVNGNTYHSVNVYVNNELVGRQPYAYGYGEQYVQSAFEILSDWGMFPYEKSDELVTVREGTPYEHQTKKQYLNHDEAWHKFCRDKIDNRQKYHITCTDVQRKKDL